MGVPTASKKIAVVIPCYNEEKGVAKVIRKFPLEKLAKESFELSILVVDNNSTDDTAKVAKATGAAVIHEPRKGKGYALRSGFAAVPSDADYVVMLDGDDTYSASEIMRMIEPLHSGFCDAVVGSRLGGNIQGDAMTLFNRLGNWIFTNAVRTVYRANISDVLTGYFAWKKSALDNLYPHLKSEGFAIEMEMVTKMARLGQRLASVPISYHPRSGESNLRPIRDGIRIMNMFAKNVAWRSRRTHKKTYCRKIVFVSDSIYPYMIGGKEKRLHEISKRLSAMGYDVHIYTMHWWPGDEKTRIESGVKLHAICRYYDQYHGDRRTIKEAIMFSLACFKLMRVKFDVLDVDHMPFFPILSTWLVCALRRRKFFGTWHEALSTDDWKKYMGWGGYIAAVVERISIHLPHTIIAASSQTKERLATIHGRAERVGLVASGIDIGLMDSVQPARIDCDVLCAARLVKDKNVELLILAISEIVKQKPDVSCVIVGKGIEKTRLKRFISRHSLQKNITLKEPFVDAADLYKHMKAAKVFCLPSLREGFGIVALEAMGCGTPVVTTDSPMNAARHLIQEGLNGSAVSPTKEALAKAILLWICADKNKDIATAVTEYDWDNLAQKQAETYAQ